MNKLKREVGPTCIACYMYSIRALFIIVINIVVIIIIIDLEWAAVGLGRSVYITVTPCDRTTH